jgi:diguanylate cyclase (GGDEF)-like protein
MEIRDPKPAHKVAPVQKAGAYDVAGVPDGELTPKARQAMTTLLGEVQKLQGNLDNARLRIDNLEKLVDEDPLVPVLNRRAFMRELTRMIAFAQRYGVTASVVYFDVDNMKQINDTHGHAAGDAALLQVAQALADNIRTTDFVGRLGGDEFGVLLVQADEERAGNKAAELATTIAARPMSRESGPVPLTVAYGVCVFSGDEHAEALIDSADRAMYQHKSKKKPVA